MAESTQTHLIISTIAANEVCILMKISDSCHRYNCNIRDSRLNTVGKDVALYMLVSGQWNDIVKLESAIARLAKRLNIELKCNRTQDSTSSSNNFIPYSIQMISHDRPGILRDFCHFLHKYEIKITDSQTEHHEATLRRGAMCNLSLTINVPPQTNIPKLRECFAIYCEDKNLDAYLEPLQKI